MTVFHRQTRKKKICWQPDRLRWLKRKLPRLRQRRRLPRLVQAKNLWMLTTVVTLKRTAEIPSKTKAKLEIRAVEWLKRILPRLRR